LYGVDDDSGCVCVEYANVNLRNDC
jgi:hypothetical protein